MTVLIVRVGIGCQERIKKEGNFRGYQGKYFSDKSHIDPAHSKDLKSMFTHLTPH